MPILRDGKTGDPLARMQQENCINDLKDRSSATADQGASEWNMKRMLCIVTMQLACVAFARRERMAGL